MRIHLRALLLAASVALSACGGGGGGLGALPAAFPGENPGTVGPPAPGPGTQPAPAEPPATTPPPGTTTPPGPGTPASFRPPPNPSFTGTPAASTLSVAVRLEDTRRASADIGVDGGTVTATDARGNSYRLEIPAGALGQTTTVSITPVADVSSLPFTRLVAAAHFEPDGLQLMSPGQLRVQTREPLDASQLAGFGYLQSGNDLVLQPIRIEDANTFTLVVPHFSGAGAAAATQAERQAQIERQSSDWDRTYQNMASALVQEARNSGGDNGGQLLSQLAALHHDYYTKVVSPLLDAAEANPDDFAVVAVQKALGLARALALLGDDSPLGNEILQRVVRVLEKAWMEFSRQCFEEHAVIRGGDLLRLARTLALMGIDPPGGLQMFLNCYRFELTLESQYTIDSDSGTATIDYAFRRMLLEPGPIPAKQVEVRLQVPSVCTRVGERENLGLARLPYFELQRVATPADPPRLPRGLADVDLIYILPQLGGQPEEVTLLFNCPDGPGSAPFRFFFSAPHHLVHQSELVPAPNPLPPGLQWPTQEFGVRTRGWQIGPLGSDVIARKEYSGGGIAGATERFTRLTLRHVPLPPPVPLH